MEDVKYDNAVLNGPIWKQLIVFGLPLLLGNLFQQLYSSVDSVIVGQYVGKEALAAVGSTTSLMFLIVSFFQGIATGSNVIIAQYIGSGEQDNVKKSISSSIVLSLFSGIVFGVFFYLLIPSILRWTLLPADIFDMTNDYLRIYMFSLPALALYNTGTAILRAMGDSRRPLYFLILSSIVNVVLDLLFVCVLEMGVAGASWASVISQVISAALILYVLVRGTGPYAVDLHELQIDSSITKRILLLGLPAAVQSSAVSLANVLFQSQVNIFGSTAVAGYSAGTRINTIIYMPCVAFSLAATTFVGQSFGAKNYTRIRDCARVCMGLSITITACAGLLAFLLRYPLIGIFTSDPEAMEYGALSLVIIGLPTFLWAFPQIYGSVVTGMGRSMASIVIIMINMCGVRLLWIFALLRYWDDILVVYLSYPVSWAAAGLCMFIYYQKTMRRLIYSTAQSGQ